MAVAQQERVEVADDQDVDVCGPQLINKLEVSFNY